ncbi:peptide deformylase [bacterium]|nr:peptide deformylase [bacterium]
MIGIILLYDYITIVAILKIAKLGHPVLIKKTSEINNLSDNNLKKLVFDMSETMLDANGIGLASPQVHSSHRMFIYRNPDKDEESKINISVLINPIIEKMTDDTEDDWEGCLSIPGMSGLVRRFKKIKYSALDMNGKNISGEVEGLHARVIQHEFDHLNGVLYTSRLAHKNAFGYSEEIEKFWKKSKDEESK